jgi:prevent-host-death family protein
MDLSKDIKPITDLKQRPAAIIEALQKNHRPIVITQNGQARAVVQDIASFEATRKALLLLKLTAQAEADVRSGRTVSQAKLFKKIDGMIRRHGKKSSI